MHNELDTGVAAVAGAVQTGLVAKYAPALLLAAIPAVLAWAATWNSLQNELRSKAPASVVDSIQRDLRSQSAVLAKVEARQLVMFCASFPQSFECLNNTPKP